MPGRTDRPLRFTLRAIARRPLWAALAAYGALYMSWMVFRWGPADRKLVGDLFQICLNAVAVVLCVGAARRCAPIAAARRAWLTIGIGVLSYALGNVAQLVYEVSVKQVPYPCVDDLLYLLSYPLLFAGLLQFPTRRSSGSQRLQIALDAAVLAIGGAAVVWYVELGPTLTQISSQGLFAAVVSVLYPVGDLIVIAALAGVLTRGTLASSTRALRLFSAGCGVYVTADLIYSYITLKLNQTYSGGDWLDAVYFLGLALWALAPTMQGRPRPDALAQLSGKGRALRRRPSWVPYLAVATGLALTVYVERDDRFYPAFSMVLVTVALVVLAAVRQLAAQSELISVQHELEAAHDELAALATTDALTGLPNHRGLVATIDSELERATRYGHAFALAFLDLDHFKTINDTLGHAAGDATLREITGVLKRCLRGVDVAGRWGGEEFLVVLPESDSDGAARTAERIRAAIAKHPFRSTGGAHVTCSIGVAVRPVDGDSRDALLESADRAMYAAKHLGRNQVISAHDHAAATLAATASRSDPEQQALLGAVEALAGIVDARDRYTGAHSASVAMLCTRVAIELRCDASDVHLIGIAARLHDIGKVAVPDNILNKPGRLTEEEWTIMRRHSAIGAEIAGRIPRLCPAMPLIRGHHERIDGTGYPDRLAGDAIPLGARIIAVADAYSAIVTDRPYCRARSEHAAVAELRRCAGTQFDSKVVDALAQVLVRTDLSRRAA